MARRFIFICDGCDTQTSSASAEVPTYWADVSISVSGYTNWRSGGCREQKASRLVCGSCQIILRDQADPANWPRPENKSAPELQE